MNNRRKANEFLELQLENVTEKNPLCLYMCDVNSFKKINDVYGHSEGNQALIAISRVLKKTISKYEGFAARFGDDEFIFAWHPAEGDSLDSIIEDIDKMLYQKKREFHNIT